MPDNVRMADHPTLQSQLVLWSMQSEQRAELGDDLDGLRPVDHFAYFRRRSSAVKAALQLEAEGFATTSSRRGLKVVLQATRDDKLDSTTVERFLGEVIDIVEGAGGVYDGWGAPTASRADPS